MKNIVKSRHRQIKEKIRKMPFGAAFVTSDFLDITDADVASKSLLRLEESGFIKRVIRGVYTKCDSDKNAYPTPDEIAHAIARINSWSIAPCRETALYTAGLSDMTPKTLTYVSTGCYREYNTGNLSIRFLHTSERLLALSDKTALAVQIIKAYGKEKLGEERFLIHLARILCPGNEETLIRESANVSEWIHKTLLRMCALLDSSLRKESEP